MSRPLSLHLRLALMAMVMVVATLSLTTYLLFNLVTWVLSSSLDLPLDAQIRSLDKAMGPDGDFDPARLAFQPELQHPAAGWGWEVVTPRGTWRRGLPLPALMYPLPLIHPASGVYSGYDSATRGKVLHVRRFDSPKGVSGAHILVVAPQSLIEQPLAQVRKGIWLVLALVSLVLGLASWIQLHFGLRPLRQLGAAVARVRRGEQPALPGHQPAELAPLAQEVNALILRNNTGLETARLNAANLAHAVKTPLATLMLQLEEEGASQEAKALVAHVSERVAHHLRRARSAAVGLGGRARANVHEAADMLRPVLVSPGRRDGRLLHIENRVDPACFVAVDAEDLSEMLGNLLENACRYARSHIMVEALEEAGQTVITVTDDGPGIPAAALATVLQPGVRLDEVSQGYGLGLAITRELAGLYEGTLVLGPAPGRGGLQARLTLPR